MNSHAHSSPTHSRTRSSRGDSRRSAATPAGSTRAVTDAARVAAYFPRFHVPSAFPPNDVAGLSVARGGQPVQGVVAEDADLQHPRLSGEKPGVRNRRRDGAGFKKAMEGHLSRLPGAYQHVLCEAHPVDAAGHEVDDVTQASGDEPADPSELASDLRPALLEEVTGDRERAHLLDIHVGEAGCRQPSPVLVGRPEVLLRDPPQRPGSSEDQALDRVPRRALECVVGEGQHAARLENPERLVEEPLSGAEVDGSLDAEEMSEGPVGEGDGYGGSVPEAYALPAAAPARAVLRVPEVGPGDVDGVDLRLPEVVEQVHVLRDHPAGDVQQPRGAGQAQQGAEAVHEVLGGLEVAADALLPETEVEVSAVELAEVGRALPVEALHGGFLASCGPAHPFHEPGSCHGGGGAATRACGLRTARRDRDPRREGSNSSSSSGTSFV